MKKESRKGIRRNTGRTHFKKGFSPWNKGKAHSNKVKEKLSKAQKLRFINNPNPFLGKKHSEESRKKMREAQLNRGYKGEKHHSWKGGVTPINEKIRKSIEYRLWRESVFKRDNFTCLWCKKRGGKIHADHIKPFAFYPELRFAIDNGRTLCKECHLSTDTWGNRVLKLIKK